jgi:hypothetical protein
LSYAALSGEFSVAVSTISLIIPKVLDAIYVSMKDDYLPFAGRNKMARVGNGI